MARPEKPEACDTCGHVTSKLTFVRGQGRADGGTEDVPWTLADHWFCRLCNSGPGFEVHQDRVNHGLAQGMNIILEILEKKRG